MGTTVGDILTSVGEAFGAFVRSGESMLEKVVALEFLELTIGEFLWFLWMLFVIWMFIRPFTPWKTIDDE